MSTPYPKRRRLDAMAQLNKPFRSPFKTPGKSPTKDTTDSTPQDISANTTDGEMVPQNNILAAKSTNTLLTTKTPVASKKLAIGTTPILRSDVKNSLGSAGGGARKFRSPVVAKQLNNDPDIAPLIRAQKELEKTLREVKEELDAAEQATRIEHASLKWNADNGRSAGDKDEEELEVDWELVELCGKWREASRKAAEELFTNVRERVNRSGGPRAWKAAQKKREEDQNAWDQEEQVQNEDEDSEDENGNPKPKAEKRDVYVEYGIDPETENERNQRSGPGAKDIGERAGDEDEFSMGMMLRTLNVELDVIGWDRDGQRWSD